MNTEHNTPSSSKSGLGSGIALGQRIAAADNDFHPVQLRLKSHYE